MAQYVEIMGHTVLLYDFWNAVSTAVMFFYLISQTKKFSDISPFAARQQSDTRKILVGIGEVLAIIAVAFVLFRILNPAFGKWFTGGNANYYGSLTAWFLAITILAILFKTSPFHVHDLFAPALPIQLFLAKLSCFFHGCCYGFEVPGSWYFNQRTGRSEFPVQLTESLIALALFVFLRRYQKRNRIPGSIFPVYLILFAVSRLMTEFLRADLPNVFGPLNAYQIMSVVYAFFGAVLLGVAWKYNDAKKQQQKAHTDGSQAEA